MKETRAPASVNERLVSAVESVLLVAASPVSIAELAAATATSKEAVIEALDVTMSRLTGGIRVQRSAERAQLVTAAENVAVIHRFLGTEQPPPLSRALLETLTVIAYRQPVTRPEIEAIRGANSDRAVAGLLARDLIEERGARPTLGRPMQYGTGFAFLQYFGLASLAELPPLPQSVDEVLPPEILGLRTATDAQAPN